MNHDLFSTTLGSQYTQYSFDIDKDINYVTKMGNDIFEAQQNYTAGCCADPVRASSADLLFHTVIQTYEKECASFGDAASYCSQEIKDMTHHMNSYVMDNYEIIPISAVAPIGKHKGHKGKDKNKDIECAILTSDYKRCRNEVKCVCNSFRSEDGIQRNIYLCTLHLNTLTKDPKSKRPFKYGLYFESDLYADPLGRSACFAD